MQMKVTRSTAQQILLHVAIRQTKMRLCSAVAIQLLSVTDGQTDSIPISIVRVSIANNSLILINV